MKTKEIVVPDIFRNYLFDNSHLEIQKDDENKVLLIKNGNECKKVNFKSKNQEKNISGNYNNFNKLVKKINKYLRNTRKNNNNKFLFSFGEEFDFNAQKFMTVEGESFKNCCIQTFNIVGILVREWVNTGEPYQQTIIIKSRFGGNNFLYYLLNTAEGFFQIPESASYHFSSHLDHISIYMWKQYLKKAFQLGLPKHYINVHENTSRVRGRLDTGTLARHPSNDGKYPCSYSKFSYDNKITRLIAFTFDKLMKNKDNRKLLAEVYRAGNLFRRVADFKSFDKRSINQIEITNPYYFRYRRLVELSKLLLRNRGLTPGIGENKTGTFLFDISLLFEHHIRKLLKRFTGLNILSKDDSIFNLKVPGIENEKRKLKPDIVIVTEEPGVYIFDVKYKCYSERTNRNDFYQLASYLSFYNKQFEYRNEEMKVKGGGFIFPERFGEKERGNKEVTIQTGSLKGNEYEFSYFLCFYPVFDPKTEYSNEYKPYHEQMIEIGKKFAQKFQNVIT